MDAPRALQNAFQMPDVNWGPLVRHYVPGDPMEPNHMLHQEFCGLSHRRESRMRDKVHGLGEMINNS